MARIADEKFRNGDRLQTEYAKRIFGDGSSELRDYISEEIRELLPEVAAMTPQLDRNRTAAKVRYYCDNDRRDYEGHYRWKLREDPPWGVAPEYYELQVLRPMPHEFVYTGSFWQELVYQEWFDADNNV
ncbi:MAG: hypothetical protein Q9227_004540 [Pyrenula ochraceoflavens]